MPRTSEKRQRLIYVAADLVSTSLAWFLFNIIRWQQVMDYTGERISLGEFYHFEPVILGQILFPLMMMGIYALSGYYNRPLFRSRLDELVTTIYTAAIGTITIFFLAIIDDPVPDRESNLVLLVMLFGLMFGVVYLFRFFITSLSLKKILHGELVRPMLVLGTSADARRMRRKMEQTRGRGHKILAYVAFPDKDKAKADIHDTFDGLPVISLDELPCFVARHKPHGIIIPENTFGPSAPDFSTLLTELYPLDIPIFLSSKALQLVGTLKRTGDLAGEPLINICATNMPESTRNIKRMADIIVSSIALLLLSPFLIIIGAIIRIDSPGPILYRQERIGYHKRRFNIIKFRTMINDAEPNGPCLSSDGDERITRVGRFLRKYRIDEFPQFFNVLRGDMSLVGPRPEREYFIRQIVRKAPFYSLLHQVRPGLTSLGMVKHGYASSVDDMVDRARFDIIYIENISLMTDLKILLYTVNTVLTGQGV